MRNGMFPTRRMASLMRGPLAVVLGLLLVAVAALVVGPPPVRAATALVTGWGRSEECQLPPMADIEAGRHHSLALTDNGQVIAWGLNEAGQCMVPLEAQSGVIAIAAGYYHSLALTNTGKVIAWGSDECGQCSVPPEAQSGIIAIAAGAFHSLALTQEGEVVVWGREAYGICAVPDGAKSGIIAIAAGAHHNLALTNTGKVIAWGQNEEYGQCGVPVDLTNVHRIAAGGQHSLVLTDDGTVIAWGRNTQHQCDVPGELAGLTVIDIAGGWAHSLALTDDGRTIAWGWDYYDQCMVPPEAESGVGAISGGYYHSLALKVGPPVADFTAAGLGTGWGIVNGQLCIIKPWGTQEVSVAFTDLSTSSPKDSTQWLWEFGDGTTSTEENPIHVYKPPIGVEHQVYSVKLTVKHPGGSDDEIKDSFIVMLFIPA